MVVRLEQRLGWSWGAPRRVVTSELQTDQTDNTDGTDCTVKSRRPIAQASKNISIPQSARFSNPEAHFALVLCPFTPFDPFDPFDPYHHLLMPERAN
jgi:hypothetical protein